MSTETFPDAARHAEIAREAIKAMGATVQSDMPLLITHDMLSDLREIARTLPPVFELIADAIWHEVGSGLQRKLSPVDLRQVMQQLNIATGVAAELDDTLRVAQNLIAVPAHRDVDPAEH